MKRNKTILIAICLIAIFNISQTFSQTNKAVHKPKNIIFMIGDGMGTAQVYSALVAKKDKLNIARCK